MTNCCTRCENAKPKSPCHCRCGGRYHGSKNNDYPEEFYKTLNANIGGEAGKLIERLDGQKFKCWCGKHFTVNHFLGYEHDGGLEDEQGTKWWIFAVCPNCKYEWSYWKLEKRLNRQKEEKEQFKQEKL